MTFCGTHLHPYVIFEIFGYVYLYLPMGIGGTPTKKKIRFNTFVFRKDKWGIIVKVIIRTS